MTGFEHGTLIEPDLNGCGLISSRLLLAHGKRKKQNADSTDRTDLTALPKGEMKPLGHPSTDDQRSSVGKICAYQFNQSNQRSALDQA
jgi:hypothetical protein